MTDDELLTRLAELPVAEWTSDEVEQLRHRAHENPAIRVALAEHLLIESALNAGLTRRRITAEQVLSRVDSSRRSRLSGRWGIAAAILLLTISIGGGFWFYRHREDAVTAPIADRARPPLWDEAVTHVPPLPTSAAPSAPIEPSPFIVATPVPELRAPDPESVEPWTSMLARPARTSADLWFDDRRLTHDEEGLKRWWDVLSGQQYSSGRDDHSRIHLSGSFRLRAPWPSDAVLSVWPNETNNETFRLYLWAGEQGVMLEQGRRPYERWAAYETTRQPDEPWPITKAFAAGDVDRSRRAGLGPFDLRYHDGRLYLSRGDILLLSTRMPALPDEIFLEGKFQLKGMGLARASDFPPGWIPLSPAVESLANPASQPLTSLSEGATLERLGDDGLALVAGATKHESWAALPIESYGLHEFYFDIESADPGTGVYLGDAEGRPRVAIGVVIDSRTARRALSYWKLRDEHTKFRSDPRRVPEPCIAESVKLRLVGGAGTLKCYASRDGLSWGRPLDPLRGIDGGFPTVGVYASPGRDIRSIRVRTMTCRKLLDYDDEIAGELPPLPDRDDDATWLARALVDEPSEEVRYHRLVKALSLGVPHETAERLLVELATLPCGDMPADVAKTVEADLDYVGRLTRFVDGWNPSVAALWAERILQSPAFLSDRPANEAFDPGIHAPFTSVRTALIEATPETPGNVQMLPADPIRHEIARLILDGDWDRLAQECRAWHSIGGRIEPHERNSSSRPAVMSLVDWAAAQADRHREAPDGILPVAPQAALRAEWRHPLVEQFGKEGYNVLAELETALDERAYDDACRIITSVTASQAVGLLPNAHDADLLTSLPGAVALAMHVHPELRAAMQRQFGDLAMLRLHQASADGDVEAVRALTTQFYGSSAAAQAQAWLGDRALAEGDAARAQGHYETAQREAFATDVEAIEARLRLTAAWEGREYGVPPATSIRLGDSMLSPIEFERVVQMLRARSRSPSLSSRSAAPAYPPHGVDSLPAMTAYRPHPWAKIEGDFGKGFDAPPKKELNFAATQIAVAFADDRMFVSNRFQIAAYELKDGKPAWQTGLGVEQGRAYQWPAVSMPPVVVDGRMFVRRLPVAGPELACLNAVDGRVLWRSPRGEIVASDPLVVGDRVAVVTTTVPQPEMLELALTTFDARSGRLLGRRTIAQLRDFWKRELPCFLVQAEEMLVVGAAGCVIGCDAEGEPRWTRKLLWLPPSVDSYIGPPTPIAPTVEENRVEVVQPGVPFRSVIDARTGAIVDRAVEVRDERPSSLGLQGSAPILRMRDGRMLVAMQAEFAGKLHRSQIAWTIGERVSAETPLDAWSKQVRGFGPVVAHNGRLWAFTVDDPKKNSRAIVELRPETRPPSIEIAASDATAAAVWKRSTMPLPWRDLAGRFSGWTFLAPRIDEKHVLENRLFLEDDCVLTSAVNGATDCWTRTVALPADESKVLHLRTAAAGENGWKLVVRVDEKTLFEREYAGQKNGSPWHDERIDLAPFRGRAVTITLANEAVAKKSKSSPLAAWQRMEIE